MNYSDRGEKCPVLSIIVPVYNVEAFLPDCLDSLLDQGIPEEAYEIICVNDGSTDGSGDVLERYAAEHESIRVFSQPNGGVSAARNLGLSMAEGEYVWFVDSDDIIRSGFLTQLLPDIDEEDSVLFGFERVDEGTKAPCTEPSDYRYLRGERDLNKLRSPNETRHIRVGVGQNAWTWIVRRSMLEEYGIRMETQLIVAEDTFFSAMVQLRAKRISTADTVGYYYRMRSGSAMHSKGAEAGEKAYTSMKNLVSLYKREIDSGSYSDEAVRILKVRYNHACESALFVRLPADKGTFRESLEELKQLGFYPFKYRKDNLRRRPYPTMKAYLLAITRFLLPFEPYARLYAFAARTFNLFGRR